MAKIKFIGPKYLVAPLAILGIAIFPADNEAEAQIALATATKKKEPGIIFITEHLAVDLGEQIDKLNQRPDLNIVLIPDSRGSTGLASNKIDILIKRAIGADVIVRK